MLEEEPRRPGGGKVSAKSLVNLVFGTVKLLEDPERVFGDQNGVRLNPKRMCP